MTFNPVLRNRALNTILAEEQVLTATSEMVSDPFLRKHYASKAQDMALAAAVLRDAAGITPEERAAAAVVDISLKLASSATDSVTLVRNFERVLDRWPRIRHLFGIETK